MAMNTINAILPAPPTRLTRDGCHRICRLRATRVVTVAICLAAILPPSVSSAAEPAAAASAISAPEPVGKPPERLPPVDAAVITAPVTRAPEPRVASLVQFPETLPATPPGEFTQDDAGFSPPAADGYGLANGVQYAFWGWLSYENSPQAGLSSFRAWEAEMDVTKTFTDRIAAAADIDFYDSNEYYWFTWSGGAIPHIEQLFLSFMLPDKNDSVLTVGKFNTPFGIERRDFWDRLTGTVSLLFPARPEDLVGAMLTYQLPDWHLILRPMVVNGFNQNIDVNQQPSLAFMTQYQPSPDLALAVTTWYGPEFNNNNHDKLTLIDSTVTWSVTCKLRLLAEHLYVRTTSPFGLIQWSGAALIANYDVNDRFRVYGQWSLLDDPNGFVTEVHQQAQEFNVGFAYYFHPRVEVRLDYRHDFSHRNQPVDPIDLHDYYANWGTVFSLITAKSQDSIFLNATFGF